MKKIKIILVLVFSFLFNSCNLEEEPIFLDSTLYENPQSIPAALDGIYQKLTTYNAQERRLFVINGFSGLFNTRKNGNNINNINNRNLFSLNPVLDPDSQATWSGLYGVIAQTNTTIANITIFEEPTTPDELLFNDIAGQAYFIRAWSYFSLVRLFGDIPLWLDLPSTERLHAPKTPAKEIYAQIIRDAEKGASLINGQSGGGYPKQYASNMLLAKIYMTLATNSNLRQEESLTEANYWQMAYDEAIKAYGKYTLVSDYTSLFTDSAENSTESIFELQISQEASNSQMGRNYTPNAYKKSLAFGWFKVHADVYKQHVDTYPDDDIRITGTYISTYQNATNANTTRVYPTNMSRANYNVGHPFFFKFAEKDRNHSNQYNSQNLIVYRYAELLIMLAEISNELENGEQLGYVSEVLSRVGLTPHAGYVGNKEDFRNAIMNEYRFELIGEGEDSHNNRRRGYDYFLTNTIERHNNNPIFSTGVDLTLNTDEAEVMILPIPLSEINFNDLIDN